MAWLRAISVVDDACIRAGAPHILDLLQGGFLLVAVGSLVWWLQTG